MNSEVNLNEIRNSISNKVGQKKMNIKGERRNLDVYRIPLKLLYYNDQNDRIATYISKYESDGKKINDLSKDDRNKVIEEFIIMSDKQKFNTTKNNIKNLGQMEPGVVFIDGRVIDGNRRFTCLRNLYRETGDNSYGYFEAVILDNDITEKEIKLMELVLQHGQEGKVDYNPIEKLVGIYRDIIKNHLFDVKEYAKSIDAKEKDVEKSVELAKLMIDFLEYINAPEQFYIAKDLQIDGPLNEIYNIKQRIGTDEEKWNKVRTALYDSILMKTTKEDGSGDITRIVREFGKKVVNDDNQFEKFFEKHETYSRKINEKLNECPRMVDTDYIRNNLREDEELKEGINKEFQNAIYSARKLEAAHAPVEAIKNLNDDLSKIDLTAVSRINGSDRVEFADQLKILKERVEKLEENFNEVI